MIICFFKVLNEENQNETSSEFILIDEVSHLQEKLPCNYNRIG